MIIAKDIDNYIAIQPVEIRETLEKLRQIIKKNVPEAEELISYQMPSFRFHGKLVWFATFKNHYSVFFLPKVLEAFKDELTPYETTKSAIKIPLDKRVPVSLITKLVKYGAKDNLEKVKIKSKK
jgi:uncharacterized protein YdhG (YjbR/CyaY superfamily)